MHSELKRSLRYLYANLGVGLLSTEAPVLTYEEGVVKPSNTIKIWKFGNYHRGEIRRFPEHSAVCTFINSTRYGHNGLVWVSVEGGARIAEYVTFVGTPAWPIGRGVDLGEYLEDISSATDNELDLLLLAHPEVQEMVYTIESVVRGMP